MNFAEFHRKRQRQRNHQQQQQQQIRVELIHKPPSTAVQLLADHFKCPPHLLGKTIFDNPALRQLATDFLTGLMFRLVPALCRCSSVVIRLKEGKFNFSRENADELQINHANGHLESVKDYYRYNHFYILSYPQLPCIVTLAECRATARLGTSMIMQKPVGGSSPDTFELINPNVVTAYATIRGHEAFPLETLQITFQASEH